MNFFENYFFMNKETRFNGSKNKFLLNLKNNKTLLAIEKMNALGQSGTPFVFIIDYALKQPQVLSFEAAAEKNIFFEMNGVQNFFLHTKKKISKNIFPEKNSQNVFEKKNENILKNIFKKKFTEKIFFEKNPETFDVYEKKIKKIIAGLKFGNSFLANLTCATPIETNLSLKEIFLRSHAKYKLLYKNKFVCFSPETFIKIAAGKISTYPMKGTIDVAILNAENIILNDEKEKAEHITTVDLLRNDLGSICDKVWVEKFRYTDKIFTHNGALLQVSSEICGTLPSDYLEQLGTLLFQLLPAGSICGAPKQETLHLIKSAEDYERGFYTGICGVFDGKNLDSGVLIRFIERTPTGLVFKSGGGITAQSNPRAEYEEMIQKIYLGIRY